ncbi:penicillin-binding protein activator [uncultured Abyssibacter sp.]|uniref:penicillin-binding protein activator n=1 Tax=uncultured Abyssibacter sp. TaxID=2320202 RepID=UPI0032B21062
MNLRAPYPICLAGLAALCLAACSTTPVPAPSPTVNAPAVELGPAERAARLMQQAAGAGVSQGSQLRLQAAELYVQAQDTGSAVRALTGVDTSALPAEQRVLPDILRAEIALQQGHPLPALNVLPPPSPTYRPQYNDRIQSAYAEGLFQIGDLPYAVEALVQREAYLTNPEDVTANREQLWDRLMQAPLAPAMFERAQALDPTTQGWLELARLARSVWSDPAARQNAAAQWREQHFGHPAADRYLGEAMGRAAETATPPARIALLLPQTGPYAAPGQAVRDGFMAAWMLGGGFGEVHVFDTGSGDVFATLQAALALSPDIIVGPLRKDAVDTVTNAVTGGVPVLALNQATDTGRAIGRKYQFALSPEEEARQIADKAFDLGLKRVIALVPESDWGARSMLAMAERLQARGGRVLASRTYDPNARDFSGPIRDVLQLDASRDRHREVARALGFRPEFQPRRRNDVDFVFLAAPAQTARAIKPQLRFHFASDLPVIATSQVFDGQPDAQRDADLEGILYPEIPWILDDSGAIADVRKQVETLWPSVHARFPRLYAFGFDAYRLLPALSNDGLASGPLIDSATGQLYVRPDGTVGHRLQWAQFERGVPVPLPPEADTP